MRLSWVAWLAIVGIISLGGMQGCRRRRPPPVEPEEEVEAPEEEVTPSEEEAPPAVEEETPEPEPEPEPEKVTPELEAVRLYQKSLGLFSDAKDAWRAFRDEGEKKEDWQKAWDLLVQAQEQCEQASDKSPENERFQELASQIVSMRRTLMDSEPE